MGSRGGSSSLFFENFERDRTVSQKTKKFHAASVRNLAMIATFLLPFFLFLIIRLPPPTPTRVKV